MTKSEMLEILKLLSAIESWSFAKCDKTGMPDYMYEQISNTITVLTKEILKNE